MVETSLVTTKKNTVEAFLNDPKARDAMAQVIPQHIGVDRLMRVALSALKRDSKLRDCSPESFLGAVWQACLLGLELNTPLGYAYLVPYKTECTFIPGYKGLLKLAYQSGMIKSIRAHVVYDKEDFSIEYGTSERIHHVPVFTADRGEAIGAYCVIELKDGGIIQRFMPTAEINKAKPSYVRSGPWVDHWDEMAMKTVLRRTLKTAPLSTEVSKAIVADEGASRGATWKVDLNSHNEEPQMIEHETSAETITSPAALGMPTGKAEPGL